MHPSCFMPCWLMGLAMFFSPCALAQKANNQAKLDKEEAKKALTYLNCVRGKPGDFSKEIATDLKDVQPQQALQWHEVLAKVAEEKALDMANRDYVAHQTPEGLGINHLLHAAGYKLPEAMLGPKNANLFESIAAGYTSGKGVIQGLLLDKGVPELLHRKHLLGMNSFHAGCQDVGIGFARNAKSKFKTYICIIIARQK